MQEKGEKLPHLCDKILKHLRMSKKSCTFAAQKVFAYEKEQSPNYHHHRDDVSVCDDCVCDEPGRTGGQDMGRVVLGSGSGGAHGYARQPV